MQGGRSPLAAAECRRHAPAASRLYDFLTLVQNGRSKVIGLSISISSLTTLQWKDWRSDVERSGPSTPQNTFFALRRPTVEGPLFSDFHQDDYHESSFEVAQIHQSQDVFDVSRLKPCGDGTADFLDRVASTGRIMEGA